MSRAAVLVSVGLLLSVVRNADAQKMYWIEGGADPAIWRANLDGSSPELVLSGLDSPQGIAIDPIPEPSSIVLMLTATVLLCVAWLPFHRPLRRAHIKHLEA